MKQGDVVFYHFSGEAVVAGDFTDFIRRFGPEALPHGAPLFRMMNKLVSFVGGYDHDEREIYAIPEVRAFYRRWIKKWPYLLYFGNLQTESLMTLVLCTVPSLESTAFQGMSQVRVMVDPRDLLNFVAQHLPAMNTMCERAGLSERQVRDRTREVFEYFGLPFLG